MLKDEVALYSQLTGRDGLYVPVGIIGAYLDGYERGKVDAQPEIIYCKDCRKHNKRIGDYKEKSDGTYDWIWKDQACPLAEFRGVAQGHEFDYQFCAYAERKDDE